MVRGADFGKHCSKALFLNKWEATHFWMEMRYVNAHRFITSFYNDQQGMVRQCLLRLPVPPSSPRRGLHPPLLHGLPTGRRRDRAWSWTRGTTPTQGGVEKAKLHCGELRESIQVRAISFQLFFSEGNICKWRHIYFYIEMNPLYANIVTLLHRGSQNITYVILTSIKIYIKSLLTTN